MTESTQQLLARVSEILARAEKDPPAYYRSDIPALCQAVQELANPWISVKDVSPEVGEWYWVVCDGHVQRQAARLFGLGFNCCDGYRWEWADSEADTAPAEAVTHYMSLPFPPQEKP